jgi:hypothetical protein
VRELVAAIAAQSDDPGTEERVRGAVLMMAVCAFGDAVIGPHVRDMLGEPDDSMRALVARMLPMFLVPPA